MCTSYSNTTIKKNLLMSNIRVNASLNDGMEGCLPLRALTGTAIFLTVVNADL